MRYVRLTVVFLGALLALVPAASTAAAGASPTAPISISSSNRAVGANGSPIRNSAPSPDYNVPCWAGGKKGAADTAACHAAVLAAINHQHAVEHIAAITLPRGFWSMRPALQIFVITNLERVSRGLNPVLGVNAQMSRWATEGARHDTDPSLGAWDLDSGTRLQTFSSVWASDLNPLDADFIWMYSDGWASGGSNNLDCTSARSAGCWGHREVILGRYSGSSTLVAGVAHVGQYDSDGALDSDAQAFASYTGPKPRLVYTWDQARAAGAR